MRYEMLGSRLLVKIIAGADRTSGGLHIPQMAIDGTPWLKAEVLAVGTGRLMQSGTLVPLQVVVGDVVVFFRTTVGGEQLAVPLEDGTEGLCIQEGNVLTILRDLERASLLNDAHGRPMVRA